MPLISARHCVNYSYKGFLYPVTIFAKNETCNCKQNYVWHKTTFSANIVLNLYKYQSIKFKGIFLQSSTSTSFKEVCIFFIFAFN